MTSMAEADSVGMPDLLRSDRPDSEARSFLLAFNLLAWRPPRSYSPNQIRRRWKYLALARRDEAARVTEMTIDGPGLDPPAPQLPQGRPRAASGARPLFSTKSAQKCRRTAVDSGGFRQF
jgi:hypothetical protein